MTLPVPGVAGADRPPTFELTKQHTGKFTNVVTYSGEVLCRESRRASPQVSLQGAYATGQLKLERDDGEGAAAGRLLCALLSGRWQGESHSPTDATQWTQLSVKVSLPPPPRSALGFGQRRSAGNGFEPAMLVLAGSGVSLWRDQEVPFVLSGSLDLRTLSVELEKTHTGQYTNTVTYSCGLSLGEGGLRVEGVYAQGTLDLAPCADDAPAEGTPDGDSVESASGAPGPGGAWEAQRARLVKTPPCKATPLCALFGIVANFHLAPAPLRRSARSASSSRRKAWLLRRRRRRPRRRRPSAPRSEATGWRSGSASSRGEARRCSSWAWSGGS